MPGIGHDNGKSAAVTVYWCWALGWIRAVAAAVVVAIVIAIAPLA
jgi:hypothetical protein